MPSTSCQAIKVCPLLSTNLTVPSAFVIEVTVRVFVGCVVVVFVIELPSDIELELSLLDYLLAI
ncbi:hypothetical protein [Clostridium puniceum]|uniref:hypothetical protein n=1 Tax=Clostridium puniceum TaxID=29367 RepID=UPI001FA84506|nr:hypothetical protein [Clostridium puniceum]